MRLRDDALGREFGRRGRPVGPREIDAQEDGRAMAERLHHRGEVRAETVAQRRREPVGTIERLELGGRLRLKLGSRGRRGRMALAGEEIPHLLPGHPQPAQHEPPPCLGSARPREGAPAAQRVEHEVAHRGPVARAREPARPAPVRQGLLGWGAAEDPVEDADGGGEAGSGRHGGNSGGKRAAEA